MSADKGKGPEIDLQDPRAHSRSRSRVSSPEQSYFSSSEPANEIVKSALESSVDPPESLTLGLAPSSPMTVLGAGRIDPFADYPIKMNEGELWLIDQVNTSQDPTFRTLRERWLPVAVKDAANFHQFLANVSLNVSRVRGEDLENAVSVGHHSLAIQSINQKLSDPNLRTNDDMVVGILSFVCYSTVKEDFHSVSIHLDGLKNVIRLRGGFETIENNPVLAMLVYGVDMTRSLRQDTKPLFPLPKRMLSAQNDQSADDFVFFPQAPTSSPWKHIFPPDHPTVSAFDDLHHAVEIARLKTARKQQWRVVNFVIFRIYPIVHRLHSMDVDPNNRWSIIQEASRLGISLFLGEMRRQCGALGVSTKLYVIKLKVFMEGLGSTIDWTSSNLLLLWIMFFGLLESWKLPEQDWYVESIYAIMARTTLRSWDDVVDGAKSFLWIDEIFDERIEIFRHIVS
ncbi:uncharacterized protein LY89DRAFT_742603 [Mollisia scopiformis]|uniref:Uncharacterized protein n=1 Tax=Mollisia scopiformis TaxID=149040 RepID=A0A132B835_MOLSC|nr:uncharacterized protein LY89DRAFT_742603 [Mollisia scopiformis]KUJ07837.1 hypothetical protein LY89DRAFT_742603 [Mollisia scopiformis]